MDFIENEEQYAKAKTRMEELKGARFGTSEGIELDGLFHACHQYECERDQSWKLDTKSTWRERLASRWWEFKGWFVRKVPGGAALSNAWYWLRCHTKDRYHIIDISKIDMAPDGTRGYTWGWADADRRILLAVMAVFCDFYENEYPGHVLWAPTEEREFREIHHWWRIGQYEEHAEVMRLFHAVKHKSDDPFGEVLNPDAKDAWLAAHDAYEARFPEMLGRVMAIRQRLWT